MQDALAVGIEIGDGKFSDRRNRIDQDPSAVLLTGRALISHPVFRGSESAPDLETVENAVLRKSVQIVARQNEIDPSILHDIRRNRISPFRTVGAERIKRHAAERGIVRFSGG